MDLATYERLIKTTLDVKAEAHTIEIEYNGMMILASRQDIMAADRLLDAAPPGGFDKIRELLIPWLDKVSKNVKAGDFTTAETHTFLFAVVLWHQLEKTQ